MTRILFAPLGIITGIIAGLIGKNLFEFVWGRIDDQEAPEPSHLKTTWPKVVLAAGIEGAIFRATRAATDRGARIAFLRLTGSWPGEEERDVTE
jgi:H+/Cl- antiporter ClcA